MHRVEFVEVRVLPVAEDRPGPRRETGRGRCTHPADTQGTRGVRKDVRGQAITAELRAGGVVINRKRVERLMRQHAIQVRRLKRRHRTTIPDPAAQAVPDLLRRNRGPHRQRQAVHRALHQAQARRGAVRTCLPGERRHRQTDQTGLPDHDGQDREVAPDPAP
ncbi:IS3 family transposase [Streptomyces mirabilis]|uniref:IS3 family transposase n=1 Tax=Streptomyces mirabilis TaxID=68239 RepID=UPI0036C993D1